MEGQYSKGEYDYSGLLRRINWETLGNLEHLEISEVGFSFESMFNFLSSLNRKLRYLCIRSIHYEVHSVGRPSRASTEHQWENNRFMSFMKENSGFPELRYFRFEDKEHWDFYARVFQYCCEKSPKLEEIHYVNYCIGQEIIENTSKSIGAMLTRLGWLTISVNLNTLSIITDSHFKLKSLTNLEKRKGFESGSFFPQFPEKTHLSRIDKSYRHLDMALNFVTVWVDRLKQSI